MSTFKPKTVALLEDELERAVWQKLGQTTGLLAEAAAAAGLGLGRKTAIGAEADGVVIPDPAAIMAAKAQIDALVAEYVG